MIKMGVIGVGHLGRRHAQAALEIEDVRLEGIYDLRPEVAAEVGNDLSCTVYDECEHLIDRVDAVSIVVPTDKHFDVARLSLDHDVNVLIEKPITQSVKEAEELLRLSKEKDLVLQVGHVERFNPAFHLLLDHIDNPLFIESHRLSPFVERGTEVDVILDLMIHDIDLVLTLMGGEATDIWSVGVPVVTSSIDISNTRLSFEGNRAVSLTASRISAKRMRKLRIFQQDTYISMDLLQRQSKLYRIQWKDGAPLLSEKVFKSEGPVNPLADEISSFALSIRDGLPPRVSGEDAKRALEHALKIRESMFVPPISVDNAREEPAC